MIRKIKWNDYKLLGHLELDFTKADGSAYNTIILAGENGTGKTTILEKIATFLNLETIEPFEYLEYEANNNQYQITPYNPFKDALKSGVHKRKNINTGVVEECRTGKYIYKEKIEEDLEDIRYYGFAYSKARAGFKTTQVKASTVQQLDSNKYEDDSNDDFTNIKQLIVDINAQDNSKFMKMNREGKKISYDEFKIQSKMYRFEKAFNDFFENIKFKEVADTSKDEFKIVFEKHNKEINIDDLSTGEKQIVFRGASLLKNSKSIANGVILIDEPELSMHPKWQEKILKYYRDLFTDNGKQNAQMIIATHSEYIIRSALEDRENVLIIVLEDENGIIVPKKITAPTILPTITSAETNYLAFGILSSDYHIELYGYLQTKTGCNTVKSCDDYIISQTRYYNSQIHRKPSINPLNNTPYESLPTYIRNAIDHPSSGKTYSKEEFEISIKLLIELCK